MRPLPLLVLVSACAATLWTDPVKAQSNPASTQTAGVRPSSQQAFYLPDFEVSSSSEFGTRIGGADGRKFAFTGDGKKLVGHDAGMWRLEVWDAEKGQSLGRFGKFTGNGTLATHPTRPIAVATEYGWGGNHGPVTVWDVEKQKKILDMDEGINTSPFVAAAVAPDGRTVWLWASIGRHQPNSPGVSIRVWEVETGDEIRTISPPSSLPMKPDGTDGPQLLTFAPSGWWVATVSGRRIAAVEVATGRVRAEIGLLPAFLELHIANGKGLSAAEAIAVSGDGSQVLVGCSDGAIRRWVVDSGRELPPLVGHTNHVRAIWCSADGKVAKSMSEDKVLIWDLPLPGAGWQPPKAPTREQLIAAADSLGATDPGVRYAAAETLAADPAQAVTILESRTKTVAPIERARLDALVRNLNGGNYNEQRRAARELRQIGEPALAVLEAQNNPRQFRPDGLAPMIAQDIRSKALTAELVQAAVVVEVLERIGTPEAKKVLTVLASGAEGTTLTKLASRAAERMKARTTTTPLPALTTSWADLRSDDPTLAYRAILALIERPDEAVPLLREKLLASSVRTELDPARIPELIAALGSEEFKDREAASGALAKYGRAAEATLRAELAKSDSPEIRQRLTALLRAPIDPLTQPDAIQVIRGIEALERIATPAALAALEAVRKGATNKWFLETTSTAAKRIKR